MNQQWTICFMVVKQRETCWIRMNQQWNICFMVMKHSETCWIRMKHGHETPRIRMKHCFMVMKHLESGWNSVFHGHETCCFMPMKHLESGTVTTEISIFLYWFLVHGVSLRCFMLFHCCFMLFHCCFMLFHCCFIAVSLLFHGVSSLCFMVFQGALLPCFILFHDHETDAVGTSLNKYVLSHWWKVWMKMLDLMSSSRLFHILSATTLNARDAMSISVDGTTKRTLSAELVWQQVPTRILADGKTELRKSTTQLCTQNFTLSATSATCVEDGLPMNDMVPCKQHGSESSAHAVANWGCCRWCVRRWYYSSQVSCICRVTLDK